MKNIVELEKIIKNYIEKDIGQVRNVVYAINANDEIGDWVIYHLKYRAKEVENKIKCHDDLREIHDIFLDYQENDLFGHMSALSVVEDMVYMDLYMVFSSKGEEVKDEVVLKYPQLYCHKEADLISLDKQVIEREDIGKVLDVVSNCFMSEKERKELMGKMGFTDRKAYRLSSVYVPSVVDMLS